MSEIDDWKDQVQNLLKYNYCNLINSELYQELNPNLMNKVIAHLIQPEIELFQCLFYEESVHGKQLIMPDQMINHLVSHIQAYQYND